MVATTIIALLGRVLHWRRLKARGEHHERLSAAREHVLSSITWCLVAITLFAAILLSPWGVLLLIASVSLIGLREWGICLQRGRSHPAWFRPVIVALGMLPFAVIGFMWLFPPTAQAMPAVLFSCLVGATMVLAIITMRANSPRNFLSIVGSGVLGIMLISLLTAHVIWLAQPGPGHEHFGGARWVLTLFILTEMNDIAQALWGRRFGRNRITPVISPKKTWEGLVAGLITTMILSLALTILLLPETMNPWQLGGLAPAVDGRLAQVFFALLAGLFIGIMGFAGDLVFSAVKRDLGIKDFGTIMRGQGGMLDRIDSLTLTAPTMFILGWLFYG